MDDHDTDGIMNVHDSSDNESASDVIDNSPGETVVSLRWRVYGLTVITLLNVLNSTQEFLLSVTIFGMASELKFGETECHVINETRARDYLGDVNITGDELCSEAGRCSENSTLFLPDVCRIVYTGQGTMYDVLAGPIYLIIQGVATIPLVALIQSVSLRPPFAIGLLTVLWTLCTLLTAFVNDYWAFALLRFLFGTFAGPLHPIAFAYLANILPLDVQTVAFGIALYGHTVGVGTAYLFNHVTNIIGWRWCYDICGSTGLFLGIAACFMANPKLVHHQDEVRTTMPSWRQQLAELRQIPWSSMLPLILFIAAIEAFTVLSSFNITIYLAMYYPEFNVNIIGFVTILVGFPASVLGGWIGDRLRRSFGIRGRLCLCLILLMMLLFTGPLTFQTSLSILVFCCGASILFVVWMQVVALAIVSELTPSNCKEALFAIYFFLTYSIAGSVNLAVTPLSSLTSLRTAVTLLNGIILVISIALLLVPIVCTYKQEPELGYETDRRNKRELQETETSETTPLRILNGKKDH